MSVLLAACIVLAAPKTNPPSFHDGDTVAVQCPQRKHSLTLRVAEADTPEFRAFKWGDQPGRTAARDEAMRICPIGKPADVRLNKYDGRTKRWIAHIRCNGVDLSRTLVAQGLAWSYIPDKGSSIPALQKAAQDQRIGLWAPGLQSVAPTVWRANAMHQPLGASLP